jgi:UDP-glucose 4-epimerase
MKGLLITGGCGFIGVNLIDFLRRKADCDIVVLDNLSLGRKEYLESYQVRFLAGDICDPAIVKEAVAGVSAIVHLAADTRVIESIQNPRLNFEVNVIGTFNLIEAAKKAGIEQLVFASTGGAIVGQANPPVHEEIPPRPISPYGASKLAAEGYLSAFFGSYGMKTTALRFSNVYGPRSYHKGSVVAQFFKNILAGKEISVYGDGAQTRDFVYVDDVCRAILLALSANAGGQVYQLGSGRPTSVNELLDLMRDTVPPTPMPPIKYLPSRSGEILHTYSAIDKAQAELGFAPAIPLSAGLALTWDWFLSRDRPASTPLRSGARP